MLSKQDRNTLKNEIAKKLKSPHNKKLKNNNSSESNIKLLLISNLGMEIGSSFMSVVRKVACNEKSIALNN